MDPLSALAILTAGFVAGTINTIVGSGSLVTFPTLLALGYPPVVANITNTVGLVPGSVSGAVGYRRELAGQRRRATRLGIAAGLGGLTGGILLLVLPASAFERIVPFLIIVACVLVAVQPRLSREVADRRARHVATAASGVPPATRPVSTGEGDGGVLLLLGVYLTAIYGGYFGAAQSVILIAILAILIDDDLQRLNGLKNVLAAIVNGVAALLFVVYPVLAAALGLPAAARVDWAVAALIAIGAITGGQVGATIGRRMSPLVLRGAIIVVGAVVATKLLVG